MQLNQRASQLCAAVLSEGEKLKVQAHQVPGGGTLIDAGIRAAGGLEAGLRLADVCLAGLGSAAVVPFECGGWRGPAVTVRTDQPVLACMASQYAGWRISLGNYFAMGSGPFRAAAAQEELFERIAGLERTEAVVGVLETGELPSKAVFSYVAERCGVSPAAVTLLAARTASQAGTVQVVARSVETALHKLYELKFDLSRVESGWGVAPLPPVAKNDLAAIGRTNDAILYGGEVTLWVRGDDASLAEIGPRVPSQASADHGEPFSAIFEHYGRDFYRIDPLLFSPAVIQLANLDTGKVHRFGQTCPEVLERSFTS